VAEPVFCSNLVQVAWHRDRFVVPPDDKEEESTRINRSPVQLASRRDRVVIPPEDMQEENSRPCHGTSGSASPCGTQNVEHQIPSTKAQDSKNRRHNDVEQLLEVNDTEDGRAQQVNGTVEAKHSSQPSHHVPVWERGLSLFAINMSANTVGEASAGIWIMAALFFCAASVAVAYVFFIDEEADETHGKAVPAPAANSAPNKTIHTRDMGSIGHPSIGGAPPTRSTLGRSTIGGTAFCPELLVPQSCECVLVIPVGPAVDFSITDVSGNVVLCARTSTPNTSANVDPRDPVASAQAKGALTLTTVNGHTLALVCPSDSTPGTVPSVSASEFNLIRNDGECYARLACMEEGRYQLTTLGGVPLNFWGSFVDHAVNVTEEGRGLLATTELCHVDFDPSGEYYRLRVAPATDVGLVLCSLLAVDRLAGKGRR